MNFAQKARKETAQNQLKKAGKNAYKLYSSKKKWLVVPLLLPEIEKILVKKGFNVTSVFATDYLMSFSEISIETDMERVFISPNILKSGFSNCDNPEFKILNSDLSKFDKQYNFVKRIIKRKISMGETIANFGKLTTETIQRLCNDGFNVIVYTIDSQNYQVDVSWYRLTNAGSIIYKTM